MSEIYFVTGSMGKFNEALSVLPGVKQIDFDLVEIQETDAEKIIEAKLYEAMKKAPGKNLFCEDTSVYINSLNGLPGPLIKWFLKCVGDEGIYKLVENLEDKSAVAKTVVGFLDEKNNIVFFEGDVEGTIVSPRGENGFGWDKIFLPNGSDKTFGEMGLEEKNKFSMRKKALVKLKEYLENGK